MAKWKSTKEQNVRSARYIYFEEGKPKTLVLTNWSFERGNSGYLFRTYVEKEDDEEVDKMWFVWDYESTESLKKKLKTYKVGKKEITVVMKRDEDEQQTFTVK